MIALADDFDSATEGMLNYAHDCAFEWGRQVWALWMREQGYPAVTLLGRIIEEGLTGAGHVRYGGKVPEGFTERAQIISVALRKLGEPDQRAIATHYAVPAPARWKAWKIGIPETTYHRTWKLARAKLARAISGVDTVADF